MKANDCTESLQIYKPHRLTKLFGVKVSFRNSVSEILFRTYLLRNFSFSPNDRLYRKHSNYIKLELIQAPTRTQREFVPSR